MRQGLMLLLGVLAVAGCARALVKGYDGPDRPLPELAVLQGVDSYDDLSPSTEVTIGSVDGVRRAGYRVSVLPGSHTVGVKQTRQFGRAKHVQFCSLDLDTAPGCLYTPIPPEPPPASLTTGGAGNWQWSPELPVKIQCAGGGLHMLRLPARCGAAEKLLDERTSR
jgi:hypothetical protein